MSDRIQILSAAVANQIAAGEVVVRPASVVKELIENSLDAGASFVEAEIEDAGRRLILIRDNGSGMSPADLGLSVRRHATSKIRDTAELDSIRSFGFRGEALPSIQSVSRFSISSRESEAEAASSVSFDDAGRPQLGQSDHAQGTVVEVRDLFYNTPARLKFLKAAATETAKIQQDLSRLALAHPEVGFRLRLGGKLSMDFPRVASFRERVAQVLGTSFLAEALELRLSGPSGLKISGWIGKPVLSRSNRSGQFLFINRRTVEHRLLGFTLSQAFGSLIAAGRHAVALVFVEMPQNDVDVNVHPAKLEVRFRDERAVLDAIRHAAQEALAGADLMAAFPLPQRPSMPFPRSALSSSFGQGQSIFQGFATAELPAVSAPHQVASTWVSDSSRASEMPPEDWPAPLAQLHRSYILCQERGGLVVVDQHAAHERVLYEAVCKALEAGSPKSQRLLLPQALELGPSAALRLRGWMEALASMGLEISDMGEGSFFVLSIPSFMKNVRIPALIQELMDEIGEETEKDPLGIFRREVAARMACRAAIKAGDALNLDEMRSLMADLFKCEVPWSCPHGRPPFVRLGLEELEKYFDRR